MQYSQGMFSLDDTCRYWLYNRPVDMRKSFNGLSGIVTNAMCEKLRSGDVSTSLLLQKRESDAYERTDPGESGH